MSSSPGGGATARIPSRRAWLLIGVAAVVIATVRYTMWLRPVSRFQDLTVYRNGAQAVLHGLSPFADRAGGHGDLVFTYPPFAALAFVPLTPLAWPAAVCLMLTLSAFAYAILLWITGRALGWSPQAIAAAGLLGLSAEPVVRTIQQGQINLILAAMIAVDALVVPRRYRGLLVGVAAGIKIVPGAFALYFLAVGDRRAALRAAFTGATTVLLTWAIAPGASYSYWFDLVLNTGRSGGGGYPDNQSLVGVMARLTHNDHPPVWSTLPLQVAVLALCYLRARQVSRSGDALTALLAVAVGALLASPVSWSHHWVWCIPLFMLLIAQRRWWTVAAGVATFAIAPMTLSPLGVLSEAPRWLWLMTTMLMPGYGLWWLVWGSRTTTETSVSGCPGRGTPSRWQMPLKWE